MNERINEEIGALLDGRLESGPRTELLARLAASDEDYDVFADTAAVLREAEEGEPVVAGEVERPAELHEASADTAVVQREVEESKATDRELAAAGTGKVERPAEVIALRPRRVSVWRSPAVRRLAAAALLAGVALVPVLRSRANAGAWRDLGHVAALASPAGTRLPPDWSHTWAVTRGGTVADSSGLAARVGAWQVDLEVAARSGNYDQAAQIALAIGASLDKVDGTSSVAYEYRELAAAADRNDPNLQSSITSASENLTEFFSGDATGDYLALGGWTEAARLAADRREAAFFRRRESRAALEAAANLGSLGPDGKNAVARLRSVTGEGGIRNWGSVTADLEVLQRELSR